MTALQLVTHLVVWALLALAAALFLREGYRTHTWPGHKRVRPHSQHVGTAQQDAAAIEGDPV